MRLPHVSQHRAYTTGTAVSLAPKHAGLQMAGVFVFIVLAAFLVAISAPTLKPVKSDRQPATVVDIQSAPSSPANGSEIQSQSQASSTTAGGASGGSQPAGSASTTTNVTSTSNGSGGTDVTINGRQVHVPAGSTYTKTTHTAGGSSSVTVTSGNASNADNVTNNLNVEEDNNLTQLP